MMPKKKKIVRRETSPLKYYDMEHVSIRGFGAFCKSNISLVIAVTVALFFTYGIRLFWYSIGNDTQMLMADKSGDLNWSMQLGRFGYVLLKRLHIREFNPFTAFFTAFCLIWFSTLSWSYIFAIFSRDSGRNNKLIPFALVFMTMPVWAAQFYFVLQAAENGFIISLCPYVIYLLYKGFLDSEKAKIICACALLVFMISVYQPIIMMFCCGVFACFLLLQEHSGFEPRVYRNLCLKLLAALIVSLAVYFFIDRVIIPPVFHIARSDHLDDFNQWGKRSAFENIVAFLLFIHVIIGRIPLVHGIVGQIIARNAGTVAAEYWANESRVFGNVLLLPLAVLFIINVALIMRRTIPRGRRLWYMLAGIGVPLCVIVMAAAGGNMPPMRTLYALPLASAFMFFFLIRTFKKKAAAVVACLALLVAAYQAQISAQLFYSDYMRYNEDVRLAYELNNLIIQAQPRGRTLPVALVGRYEIPSRFRANFLTGDDVRGSFFGGTGNIFVVTRRGLAFMKSLGLNYEIPSAGRLDETLREAEKMPVYPDPGCVKRIGNMIVVRLSEEL